MDEKNIKSKKILEENNGEDEYEYDDNSNEEIEFTKEMLKKFQTQIKFHIFDPEKYENESHKEIIIVPPQHRLTSEILTKFEYTEVVSQRAKQIENGSPIFVEIGDEMDPIKIAEMEIKQKKCPLSIRRMQNNTIGEIWQVNEMGLPVM